MKKLYTGNYSHAVPAAGTDDHYFEIREPGQVVKIQNIILMIETLNLTTFKFVPWETNQDISLQLEVGNTDQFANPLFPTVPGGGTFDTGSNFILRGPGQYVLDNTFLANRCLFRLGLLNTNGAVMFDIKITIVIEAEVTPL